MRIRFQAAFSRYVRVCGMLALISGAASVTALPITFSGSGPVTGPAQTPPILTGLMLTGATSNYTVDGDSSWFADKLFNFNTATLMGGGTWTFSNGISSLTGSFTSSRVSSTSPLDLLYTVTGGSGIYAGYIGTGTATGATIGNPISLPNGPVSFRESGNFNLTQVPEPASGLLLTIGLVGMALRRRTVQRPLLSH